MKKFILAFALIIGLTSFCNTAEAQSINISINIGRQPAWGPVGYDYAGYYYFPDIDIYYDVNAGLFHYFDRGGWIAARYLPYAYSHYDLYGLYKVVLNVNQPWRYHNIHRRDYARYRGHHKQVVIRDSRDHRYHSSRNNRVAWHSGNKNSQYNNKGNRDNNRRNDNYRSDKGRNQQDNKSRSNYSSSQSRSNNKNSNARTTRSNSPSKKPDTRIASNTKSRRGR